MKTLKLIDIPESCYADMGVAIMKWGKACSIVLKGRKTGDYVSLMALLRELQIAGHAASGLRCHLLEYLQDDTEPFADDLDALRSCAMTLVELASQMDEPHRVQSHLGGLECYQYLFEQCVQFMITPDAATPMPYAQWRLAHGPGAIVQDTRVELVRRPSRTATALAAATATTDQCTTSQRAAIAQVVELIEIKRAGLAFAGWRPRTAALVIGPSGAGKSNVNSLVAWKAGLALWAATTGSWAPRGSQTAVSASNRLHSHLVENGPSLIVVDEADKIRARGDNANYYSTVFDEILALLDGRIGAWGWLPAAVDALSKSHFIFSGAFQDLYRRKLGDEVMFAEEVEALTLSGDEIFNAGWLPAELLNRVAATVIEIKLPSCEEVEKLMGAIDDAAGFKAAPHEHKRAARQAVMSMRGLRAVEGYALDVARRKLSAAA